MKSPNQFLNQVMSRHDLKSDYALAKFLGVTRSAISRYRNDPHATLDDEVAVRVAKALEIEPGYVMATMHAHRTKSDAARKIWEGLAKKLGGAVAALVLGVGVAGAPSPANAAALQEVAAGGGGTLYIMLNHNGGAWFSPGGGASGQIPRLAPRSVLRP